MNLLVKRRGGDEVKVSSRRGREEQQIVVFKLGGEDYGIEIRQVREIIRRRVITPVPRQPAYVEGVINVRGTIIPVVNLRKRFGLTGNQSTQSHTIIVESKNGLVGIMVDSVTEVMHLSKDRIHPPPQASTSADSKYLRGICQVDDRLLIYLDVENVIDKILTASVSDVESQEGTIRESIVTTD